MLFRSFCRNPTPTSLRQTSDPVLRSIRIARSFLLAVSSGLTNTASSQTTGVPLLGPGMTAFQTTFWSGPILSGRPAALLDPSKFGPRHCGQFSPARANEQISRDNATADTGTIRFMACITSGGRDLTAAACLRRRSAKWYTTTRKALRTRARDGDVPHVVPSAPRD